MTMNILEAYVFWCCHCLQLEFHAQFCLIFSFFHTHTPPATFKRYINIKQSPSVVIVVVVVAVFHVLSLLFDERRNAQGERDKNGEWRKKRSERKTKEIFCACNNAYHLAKMYNDVYNYLHCRENERTSLIFISRKFMEKGREQSISLCCSRWIIKEFSVLCAIPFHLFLSFYTSRLFFLPFCVFLFLFVVFFSSRWLCCHRVRVSKPRNAPNFKHFLFFLCQYFSAPLCSCRQLCVFFYIVLLWIILLCNLSENAMSIF